MLNEPHQNKVSTAGVVAQQETKGLRRNYHVSPGLGPRPNRLLTGEFMFWPQPQPAHYARRVTNVHREELCEFHYFNG